MEFQGPKTQQIRVFRNWKTPKSARDSISEGLVRTYTQLGGFVLCSNIWQIEGHKKIIHLRLRLVKKKSICFLSFNLLFLYYTTAIVIVQSALEVSKNFIQLSKL